MGNLGGGGLFETANPKKGGPRMGNVCHFVERKKRKQNIHWWWRMTAFQGQKVVHLDLKGAPPKVAYLLRLIPLLREWGATGILIEYEDMFPYKSDTLHVLPKEYCYSLDDIRRLQQACENENLTFIPLIQTFGHLEFVLKHKKFETFLETVNNPMSLCPLHKGSLALVKSLVDQMLEGHEELKYLHVGGDEVGSLVIQELGEAKISVT